jgi:hypothetical protein
VLGLDAALRDHALAVNAIIEIALKKGAHRRRKSLPRVMRVVHAGMRPLSMPAQPEGNMKSPKKWSWGPKDSTRTLEGT